MQYYIIQLLLDGFVSWVFTRWGRVGEPGQNQTLGPFDLDGAKAAFAKKFKDKTSNDWAKRATFTPVKGKCAWVRRAVRRGRVGTLSLSCASSFVCVQTR